MNSLTKIISSLAVFLLLCTTTGCSTASDSSNNSTASSTEAENKMKSTIRLYLPSQLLEERIGVKRVSELASYCKKLEDAANEFCKDNDTGSAKGILVAVGVKPDKKSKVWCQPAEGKIEESKLRDLESKLNKIVPLEVNKKPVAFALNYKITEPGPKAFPDLPDSWKIPNKMIPDQVFEIIWPD